MAHEANGVLPHSAQVVANVFVEQYYKVLHQSPAFVFRFYQESSFLSRPDSDGNMTTVTTMQAINDKILSLNYEDCIVEIETADAQDSYQQGITVLVTGSITGKDNVTKKFIQTFFLAPQDKGYFVLNDVLRFFTEKNLKERELVENGVTESALTMSPEPTQLPNQPTEEIPTSNEEEEHNNVPEVCNPSENGDGSIYDGEIVDTAPQLNNVEAEAGVALDMSPPVQDDAPKKSYASILKVMKGNIARSSGYVPSRKAVVPVTKADNLSLTSAKPAPGPAPAGPTNGDASEKNHDQEEAEGYSVYVKNLPLSATVDQLHEAFKKFGCIKHDGIQVRSNKGFCFGFVEFESLSSMQSALEASSPIIIGDREAGVEEKRTSTRVGPGGRGRFGSGRGGFRGDSFRGQGSFGGGRGNGRTDYKSNGEFSGRPKGPAAREGDGLQQVKQNGRGRGGRQAENRP